MERRIVRVLVRSPPNIFEVNLVGPSAFMPRKEAAMPGILSDLFLSENPAEPEFHRCQVVRLKRWAPSHPRPVGRDAEAEYAAVVEVDAERRLALISMEKWGAFRVSFDHIEPA
jgi:hypothetical protein